jgi:hypothetical protein
MAAALHFGDGVVEHLDLLAGESPVPEAVFPFLTKPYESHEDCRAAEYDGQHEGFVPHACVDDYRG